ncbi:Hypothetical predicted protein [Octopus vulgaris]|uniref:Uncharacterized protein n=1 Tax=Octopus vulgaris TaxID=6645 RepID=A0AA36ASH9_OCTVU|nr:Hypothetical predicted protein [Octopus vulgaris]
MNDALHFLASDPRFDVPVVNVTVVAGETAVLPCSVEYLGKYQMQTLEVEIAIFHDRLIYGGTIRNYFFQIPPSKDCNRDETRVKRGVKPLELTCAQGVGEADQSPSTENLPKHIRSSLQPYHN